MCVDEVEDRECDFLSSESSSYLPWLYIRFLSEVWVQHNLLWFLFPSFISSDYLHWCYFVFSDLLEQLLSPISFFFFPPIFYSSNYLPWPYVFSSDLISLDFFTFSFPTLSPLIFLRFLFRPYLPWFFYVFFSDLLAIFSTDVLFSNLLEQRLSPMNLLFSDNPVPNKPYGFCGR